MNTGEKIKLLRLQQGMTLEDLGKKVGVGKSTVRKWETGAIANMGRDKIAKLAAVFNVSPTYLISDKVQDPRPSSAPNYRELAEDRAPYLVATPPMRTIPLVGTIACGSPVLAEENIEEHVSMPSYIHADFALRCKGDSMINARIFDGDIVYIRQQPDVDNGEIAAVLIDDEATLKRVRIFPDHIILEPENPQYRPFVFWEHEMDNVRILGKAVAFTSVIR